MYGISLFGGKGTGSLAVPAGKEIRAGKKEDDRYNGHLDTKMFVEAKMSFHIYLRIFPFKSGIELWPLLKSCPSRFLEIQKTSLYPQGHIL
jgi:hypothetical protein